MEATSLCQEYELLGVTPEDGLLKIRLAYQQLVGIYADEALASYTLFDQEERQNRLERIEAAYQRIARELSERASQIPVAPKSSPRCDNQRAEGPAIDPREEPGAYLRRAREQAGMSLSDIAQRTKLSVLKLTYIETQRFDRLPAPVYLRGFIDQYARLVGLADPQRIIELYLECQRRQAGGDEQLGHSF